MSQPRVESRECKQEVGQGYKPSDELPPEGCTSRRLHTPPHPPPAKQHLQLGTTCLKPFGRTFLIQNTTSTLEAAGIPECQVTGRGGRGTPPKGPQIVRGVFWLPSCNTLAFHSQPIYCVADLTQAQLFPVETSAGHCPC